MTRFPRKLLQTSSSVIDNGIPRYNGTSGNLIQSSSNVVIDDSGKVGIGITNPAKHLVISDSTESFIRLDKNTSRATGDGTEISSIDSINYDSPAARIIFYVDGQSNAGGAYNGLKIVGNYNSVEKLGITVNSDGYVGIGIAAPTSPLYIVGNCSADSFTDRTPFYDGDAISEIKAIKGIDGKIDHNTLPLFAQAMRNKDIFQQQILEEKIVQVKVGEEIVKERDLGAMISILVKAVQQLTARIENLETT